MTTYRKTDLLGRNPYMSRSVTVEVVASGQPRPYADEVWAGYLESSVPEGQGWSSKWFEYEHNVVPFIRIMIHDFKARKGEPRLWHEPWLESLEKVGPNRWFAVVISPYLD